MGELRSSEIRNQLRALGQLGGVAPEPMIIDCVEVGPTPSMEEIGEGIRIAFHYDYGHLAFSILAHFRKNRKAKVILLCDLYAQGNEPQAGITWEGENRVKGAIIGVMSCLLMVVRNEDVANLLFANPHHRGWENCPPRRQRCRNDRLSARQNHSVTKQCSSSAITSNCSNTNLSPLFQWFQV